MGKLLNMSKIFKEILITVLFVALSTFLFYGYLAGIHKFWDAQFIWSAVLALGWVVVALGYFHQGWKVHKMSDASEVSIVLPIAVFVVQCVLFIKGIFYGDWSLVAGALMVNSGVVFNIYQIIRVGKK